MEATCACDNSTFRLLFLFPDPDYDKKQQPPLSGCGFNQLLYCLLIAVKVAGQKVRSDQDGGLYVAICSLNEYIERHNIRKKKEKKKYYKLEWKICRPVCH